MAGCSVGIKRQSVLFYLPYISFSFACLVVPHPFTVCLLLWVKGRQEVWVGGRGDKLVLMPYGGGHDFCYSQKRRVKPSRQGEN